MQVTGSAWCKTKAKTTAGKTSRVTACPNWLITTAEKTCHQAHNWHNVHTEHTQPHVWCGFVILAFEKTRENCGLSCVAYHDDSWWRSDTEWILDDLQVQSKKPAAQCRKGTQHNPTQTLDYQPPRLILGSQNASPHGIARLEWQVLQKALRCHMVQVSTPNKCLCVLT